jgi:cell division protein FtsI (penicillin-binding protein 3)
VESIYADPSKVGDPGTMAATLAKLLPGRDIAGLRAKLSGDRRFVWIARHVDDATAESLAKLSLPGIGLRREEQRLYPQGALTSHVVGIADYDVQRGMSGAESLFDARLAGRGSPIALSIDVRAQAVVREALVSAMKAYDAKGAAGLVLDATTGEIIAFVSLPDFDPGDRRSIDPAGYRNKLTDEVHEVGGLFEIFTTAIALDDGHVTPAMLLDVTHPLRLQSTLLQDDNPSTRPLSVADAFARSSVIGAALMAERYIPQDQFSSLRRLGLFDPLPVSGERVVAHPLYRGDTRRVADRTAIGYGCGIALAPLQAALIATGIVNHGVLLPATLLRRDTAMDVPGTRIVAERTSAQMRALLRHAVRTGTGMPADVPDYEVGGKTGTSFKVVAGQYDMRRRTTWFFAGYPMTGAPKYTMLIMVDEPQGTAATGGQATAQWNAAPTAARVIRGLAPILGMKVGLTTGSGSASL